MQGILPELLASTSVSREPILEHRSTYQRIYRKNAAVQDTAGWNVQCQRHNYPTRKYDLVLDQFVNVHIKWFSSKLTNLLTYSSSYIFERLLYARWKLLRYFWTFSSNYSHKTFVAKEQIVGFSWINTDCPTIIGKCGQKLHFHWWLCLLTTLVWFWIPRILWASVQYQVREREVLKGEMHENNCNNSCFIVQDCCYDVPLIS